VGFFVGAKSDRGSDGVALMTVFIASLQCSISSARRCHRPRRCNPQLDSADGQRGRRDHRRDGGAPGVPGQWPAGGHAGAGTPSARYRARIHSPARASVLPLDPQRDQIRQLRDPSRLNAPTSLATTLDLRRPPRFPTGTS